MPKKFGIIKVEEDILKKFKQVKRLKEFQLEKDITHSEFLGDLLEKEYRTFDGKCIKKK